MAYTVNVIDIDDNVYVKMEKTNPYASAYNPNIDRILSIMRYEEEIPHNITAEELAFILSCAGAHKAAEGVLDIGINKKINIKSPRGASYYGIVIDPFTGEPCMRFRISLVVDFKFDKEEDYLQWTLSQ